jgi:hypothetical protein
LDQWLGETEVPCAPANLDTTYVACESVRLQWTADDAPATIDRIAAYRDRQIAGGDVHGIRC